MDVTRREAFGALIVLVDLVASAAQAQSPTVGSPSARPPVFRHDLPNISLDGWEVTVNHVDYPPGRVGEPHHHRGFVLAYVVEGSVVAKIIGDGVTDEERTYHAGEMFYEPIGATHQVAKNASSTLPARLLAINFAKKGE